MKVTAILASVFAMGMFLAPQQAEAAKNITFGYLVADQLHEPAPMIIKNLKLLEKRGYTVKWQEFLSGANLCQHMSSGEVDYGTAGAAPAITFRGLGLDFIFLASSNTDGSALIAGNNIKSVKELNGKNVGTPGIGSMQDALVDRIEKENGIKVSHRNMKVSDMPLFLKKGEVDAFIAWEPHISRTESLGYGHVLLTSKDVMPNHQCCALVTREKTIAADPQMADDVVAVYLEAMEWFNSHHAEAIAMISKVTGIAEKDIESAMQRVSYPMPPYLDQPSMKVLLEGLVASKKIKAENVPDAAEFIRQMCRTDLLEKHLKK